MKISFAATNPCHVYPVALELAKLHALGAYYSGYPRWKLPHSSQLPLRTHSLRTNAVYGLLKLPSRWRPNQRALFRWQDDGFDRWAGRNLEACDFIHGIPGQCLHTFRAARRLGIRTVLNHATGPVREWVRIMEPEYARIGMRVIDAAPYDADYFRREDEEYALADFHCAASTVVREQLLALGIAPERIWLAPYGADPAIFHPGKRARIPRTSALSSPAGSACAKGSAPCSMRSLPCSSLAGAWISSAQCSMKRSRIYPPTTARRRCIFTGPSRRPPWQKVSAPATCSCCLRWRRALGSWFRRL